MNQINENENKGFSLVELIVVIAIMAVLTSVLAPSLLGYVEKSRMQKDDSAMGEVTNAIKLALADQNVYDECLYFSTLNNVSCYVDSNTEKGQDDSGNANTQNGSNIQRTKIVDKAAIASGATTLEEQYHFDDTARLADEITYSFAGNMRGMTITFHPDGTGSNSVVFKMQDGQINECVYASTFKVATGSTAKQVTTPPAKPANWNKTLKTMSTDGSNAYLYNKLRSVIGDSITLTSQTYRNSNYTVFIRMGSMGGNQASAQDAIAVYGQWNGTNLAAAEEAPTKN